MNKNGRKTQLAITFNPLRQTLEHLSLNLNHLRKPKIKGGLGLSSMTTTKISHDEPISFEILDLICRGLDCRVEDVIQYTEGPFQKAKRRKRDFERLEAAKQKTALDEVVPDAE